MNFLFRSSSSTMTCTHSNNKAVRRPMMDKRSDVFRASRVKCGTKYTSLICHTIRFLCILCYFDQKVVAS